MELKPETIIPNGVFKDWTYQEVMDWTEYTRTKAEDEHYDKTGERVMIIMSEPTTTPKKISKPIWV